MTTEELGRILSEMYHGARTGEKATMIHLFGIRYADEIGDYRVSVAEIVRNSGLPGSYVTEVNKGRNLARYVVLRAGR